MTQLKKSVVFSEDIMVFVISPNYKMETQCSPTFQHKKESSISFFMFEDATKTCIILSSESKPPLTFVESIHKYVCSMHLQLSKQIFFLEFIDGTQKLIRITSLNNFRQDGTSLKKFLETYFYEYMVFRYRHGPHGDTYG